MENPEYVVPPALGLSYFQMGGFKRQGFETGWLNTALLVLILLTPFLVNAYSAVRR
jgi:hypothetical protein